MLCQPSKMLLFGWTIATLLTVTYVTCNVKLDDESHITFLLENEKNDTRNSLSWGLFDTTATVGMVFQYNISSVFPHGVDAEYVVSEAGSNNNKLPDWLQFDKVTGCLVGVPSPSDATKTFYLKVSLVNDDNSVLDVGDVFSVKVNEHTPYYLGGSARPLQSYDDDSTMVQCLPGSTVTTTTVVIDVDLNALLPSDRVKILEILCKYLGLSLKAARLVSPGSMPLVDNTALVAGPGDVKVPSHPGAWLQWEVGCGNVFAYHMGVLQKLEVASQNGDISSRIGHGVVGWHVSNTKTLHASVYRLKRQAPVATATAVQTMRPPATKVVPTVTVSESELISDPPTRIVPSLTSPVYPPTDTTDPHKPHRIKTSGRHTHGSKSKTSKPKTKTSFNSTTGVTPVQVIPTEASYQPSERIVGTTSSFEIIGNDLEPSVIMPQATTPAPTASLKTKTYIVTQPNKVVQTSRIVSTSGVLTDVFIGTPKFQTTKQLLEDSAPIVNSELGTLATTLHKVFIYRIPEQLFSDNVDGSTRNLKLQFSMSDGYDANVVPWLKFNEVTQTLFGFPLNTSNQQYFLSATNSRGKSSMLGFYIDVRQPRKDQRLNFEMSVILEADYKKFMNNVSALVDIATKISSAFGDEDPSQLVVTSIHQGSVEYSWTNSSFSSASCPTDQILNLAQYFIKPDGSLNSHFLETLKPFIIKKATIIPKGSCAFEAREAAFTLLASSPSLRSTTSAVILEVKSAESSFFLTTIVPIVLIAALVILAVIIACCLYCKRRKARQSDRDGRKSAKKGTSIIFTNELENKEDSSNKPLIMENEKPPQPPNYQRAPVLSSFQPVPRSECCEPLMSDNQPRPTQACLVSEMPAHSSTTLLQQRSTVHPPSHRNPPPYAST